ncbi:MAG: hypothetical protein LBT31_04855 [Synergistaceae bacterium]|nr:hypothetical protein [Synergistaceae bacterium]
MKLLMADEKFLNTICGTMKRNVLQSKERMVMDKNYEMDEGVLGRILITDSTESLRNMTVRINEAFGLLNQEDPAYVRPRVVKRWLLERGFLIKSADKDGKSFSEPAESALEAGISGEMRHGRYGDYIELMFDRRGQLLLREHLSDILSWRPAAEAKTKASRPPNQGKPWAQDADDLLKSRFLGGASISDLALEFGRTNRGIQARLIKHGLLEENGTTGFEKTAS